MKIPAYVHEIAQCLETPDVRVCTTFGMCYKVENKNISIRLNHEYGVIVAHKPTKPQVRFAQRYTHAQLIQKLSEDKPC